MSNNMVVAHVAVINECKKPVQTVSLIAVKYVCALDRPDGKEPQRNVLVRFSSVYLTCLSTAGSISN
jgi:hypothetical protein